MKDRYLEVTFRNEKSLAAYIYLSHKDSEYSEHTEKIRDGIIADFNYENQIIGIEITEPLNVSMKEINDILSNYRISPMTEKQWGPLPHCV
jgi:uncharacterized protein YuzE